MHVRILRSVPLLKDLSDKKLELMANALESRRYEDGEYIIRQGTDGDEFFIVKDGTVSVMLISNLDRTIIQAHASLTVITASHIHSNIGYCHKVTRRWRT